MTRPTILISPAMAVPSRIYSTFAAELSTAGFDARIVGRRGFEPDDEPPSAQNDWSYADEVGDLVEAVLKVDAEAAGRSPIVLFGHSLGGQLAALALTDPTSEVRSRIAGLVTVAASIPHVEHYPPGYVAGDIATEVLRVTDIEGYWPATGFGAPGAKTLMREWATMVRDGGLPSAAENRGEIDTPSLAIRLHEDYFVSDAAADDFESLVAPAQLTQWTYGPDDCPAGGSLDHVRWVKTPQPIAARIAKWWSALG